MDACPWTRSHDNAHAFVKNRDYVRTATVTYGADGPTVVSGVKSLTVLKTTDSEFHGFYQDRIPTRRCHRRATA